MGGLTKSNFKKKDYLEPQNEEELVFILNTFFHEDVGFGIHKVSAIRLFQKIVQILDEFKIGYFLISGALLGYVRHNDLIPWDDDIDLLVERRILDILPLILEKYGNELTFINRPGYDIIKLCFNGEIEANDTYLWNKHILNKNGGKYCWPFIDLFYYDTIVGNRIKFFQKTWKASEFFPKQMVNFLGTEVSIPLNPDYFLKINYNSDYMTKIRSGNYCHKTEQPYKETKAVEFEDYKARFNSLVKYGVDAKILQYEEHATDKCSDTIDLKSIIENNLGRTSNGNHCVMINLEKDTDRYKSTLEELKKVSFTDFVHLKGTYWKNRSQFENDLTLIKYFLRNFNPSIDSVPIKVNEFSEINDNNIHIQDGPLACYASHLRAMIYGYLNFEDYTIIVEDDASIINTENIKKYLPLIPNDWDIICLNSASKYRVYTEPFYRFTDGWHSGHFYIINHKCFPHLFKNFYPITDQVDVLISDQTQALKIYNIPNTVYQKSIATNTQNNLHVIFNSPNYDIVRNVIERIEELCLFFLNKMLPDNEERNSLLMLKIMYDTVYEYILNHNVEEISNPNKENFYFDSSSVCGKEYDDFLSAIEFFLQCTKKGIDSKLAAKSMTDVILFTISKFEKHNKKGFGKAYDYGASAHIYRDSDVIIKQYNKKLRWTSAVHNDSQSIFLKELDALKAVGFPKLLSYDLDCMQIKMRYAGESLYENFNLPIDWRQQIKSLFDNLTKRGIFYPEFRLQNILVLDGKINFIDYGLISSGISNEENCEKFILFLEKLSDKFTGLNRRLRYQLYSTFEKNLGL